VPAQAQLGGVDDLRHWPHFGGKRGPEKGELFHLAHTDLLRAKKKAGRRKEANDCGLGERIRDKTINQKPGLDS